MIYIRHKTISIEETFDLLRSGNEITMIDGMACSTSLIKSLRLRTFFEHGLKCYHPDCPLEGKFFAMERGNGNSHIIRFHLNLYAIDSNGNEVLMTHDHIRARSMGGRDILENSQPMCSPHNSEKSKEEARFRYVLIKMQKHSNR